MTTIKMPLDLDTLAGRAAMRAYLDALDSQAPLLPVPAIPARVSTADGGAFVQVGERSWQREPGGTERTQIDPPAAAAPSAGVRAPTPPLAPSHPEEGATLADDVEQDVPIPAERAAEPPAGEASGADVEAAAPPLGGGAPMPDPRRRFHGTPSETEASTLRDQDRSADQEIRSAAGAEGVGAERRGALPPPASEAPEEVEVVVASEAAPGESPGSDPEPAGEEPDWDALIARCDAGEKVTAVAAEAGVPWKKLQGRRLAAGRAKARVESEPPSSSGTSTNPADVPDELGWTPREDLKLLLFYGMGNNAYTISQKLVGRSAPDVVNRFCHLVPHAGVVAQHEALARVKRFVTEADAARAVAA